MWPVRCFRSGLLLAVASRYNLSPPKPTRRIQSVYIKPHYVHGGGRVGGDAGLNVSVCAPTSMIAARLPVTYIDSEYSISRADTLDAPPAAAPRGPPWAMYLHSGRAAGAVGSRSHRVNSIGPRGRKSVIFRAINRRYCDASFGRCFQWKSDCGRRCDTITPRVGRCNGMHVRSREYWVH